MDKTKQAIEIMYAVVTATLDAGKFTIPQLEHVAGFFEARAEETRALLRKIEAGERKPIDEPPRLVIVPKLEIEP
ncbi:hypothetical protein AMJ82_11010 [candidate division TA06 bacterium SM23_40]|uniref:Uncharacterized protein n=1 Tax=candidate division TA06 bacterium SM23_40 TaxID=1703774 RepID=A0A0S8G389_UNCT6|nr:MAG: hypothetical protein AMJ82_11010 [candidate division TA06 bacterium SM23_40]